MDDEKRAFVIIRHNFQTKDYAVVENVRGRGSAEIAVASWDSKLSQDEKEAGWDHYLEPTKLKPGSDPKFATEFIQLKIALRRASR